MKIVQWDEDWFVCQLGPWHFCGKPKRIGTTWSMTGCWWRKGFHLIAIGDFAYDNGDKLLEKAEKILKSPNDYVPAKAVLNGLTVYEGCLAHARLVQSVANRGRKSFLSPYCTVKTYDHHLQE